MTEQPPKTGMNKAWIAVAAIGGILLLKRVLRKRAEEKAGCCESLGEKIDHGLGRLVGKVGKFLDPKHKN